MIIAKTQWLAALALSIAASASAHAALRSTADDVDIASSIETALDTYPSLVPASSIQVQSIRHVVYLHGLVDTYPEKLLVQSIASKTAGVERVVNSLELRND